MNDPYQPSLFLVCRKFMIYVNSACITSMILLEKSNSCYLTVCASNKKIFNCVSIIL